MLLVIKKIYRVDWENVWTLFRQNGYGVEEVTKALRIGNRNKGMEGQKEDEVKGVAVIPYFDALSA